MSKGFHKGTELNNVRETWDRNEKEHEETSEPATENKKLEPVIDSEAREYENANKEDRLLGGNRASVNDEEEGS